MELHKVYTEVEVNVSKATTQGHIQNTGYNCHIMLNHLT